MHSINFISNLNETFFIGNAVDIRVIEMDDISRKIIGSIRQALPSAMTPDELKIGDFASGIVQHIHDKQAVLSLIPSQLTALVALADLSHARQASVADVRSSLKVGEQIHDLAVVSRNPKTGLLILAHRRTAHIPIAPLASSESYEGVEIGATLRGKVVSYGPQGANVLLANHLRGRIHPCDAADSYQSLEKVLPIGAEVSASVLNVNAQNRLIDLSGRDSRQRASVEATVIDPEINEVTDLKTGQTIRGFVKNIVKQGLFVSLSRRIVARVMIRELFDDFIKEWERHFDLGQVVTGKILSVDETTGQVEMTLRRKASPKGAQRSLSDMTTGQEVEAIVKKVVEYGLFVRVDNSSVSGLCHKSELTDDPEQDVSAALKGFREGDRVKVVIVKLDEDTGKINFSMKPSLLGEHAGVQDTAIDDDAMSLGEESVSGLDAGALAAVRDENDADSDEEDDDEVEILMSQSASIMEPSRASSVAAADHSPVTALQVNIGFDWSGAAHSSVSHAAVDDSDTDEDSAPVVMRQASKSAQIDLAASAPDSTPASVAEFERALLASPNSSFIWIQYMSFQLQLHEIDKARHIGRQAIDRIPYREEDEKLNVWMSLINLEIGYGTDESVGTVFKEAVQFNDEKALFARYVDALQAASKRELAEEALKRFVKRFSGSPEVWAMSAEFYLKQGDSEAAREVFTRAVRSLDKSKHIDMIVKMGVLEFKVGEAERGKTILEGLVGRFPKRLDVWAVYIDQLAKKEDIHGVRGLFDRVLSRHLTTKKAKFLFKKWLSIETRIGDEAGQEKAKERAREWVAANAKPVEEVNEE